MGKPTSTSASNRTKRCYRSRYWCRCGDVLIGKVPCGGTYPSSSPELGTDAHIFLDLFQDLTGAILSVVGDVSVDSEALAVTSSILKIYRLSLSKMLIGLRACS
jgi:hypothetical protein